MEDSVRIKFKNIRQKIDRIPFSNKMKSIYTLDYVSLIMNHEKYDQKKLLDKLDLLDTLINNNG